MQVTYNGEHSLLIGDFIEEIDLYGRTIETFVESYFDNVWDMYGLIPTSPPVIDPPDVQENTVEVPGSNGVVDLSDILLGHPLYYNRSGSLEFYVDHTHPKYTTWENAYDKMLNDFHGANKKVILTDAKGYYYEGRLKVNQWNSDKLCSKITFDYNFAPYKRMLFRTIEDWLWDPFDFVNGTIPDKQGWYIRTVNQDTPSQDIKDTYTVLDRIKAGTMPIVPDILLKFDGTVPDLDTLQTKPYVLYATGESETDVNNKLESGNGYASYMRTSEHRSGALPAYFTKHDPIITIGAPNRVYWGIRLVNPLAVPITMSIDFRQGRL